MKQKLFVFLVGFLLLVGCDGKSSEGMAEPHASSELNHVDITIKPSTEPSPNKGSNRTGNPDHPRIIRKAFELGPGPLTKENTSIGGIHIGDSQERVKSILGEPTEVKYGGGGTPEIVWYYEKKNAYIFFYRRSGAEPAGGVETIRIVGPSTLKTEKKYRHWGFSGGAGQTLLSDWGNFGQASLLGNRGELYGRLCGRRLSSIPDFPCE